jgi:ssDNA-binding Zn-finger/Zn-ribbon topoisomerase 1
MTAHIHDKCEGEVEIFDKDDGLCIECGDEGEFIIEESIFDDRVLVGIPFPTCNRLENF